MINKIELDYSKLDGLVPAVIQDDDSGQVLMVGFMNEEAFEMTLSTGVVHYWSRSKKRIWKKGESSGHIQEVREMRIDCDDDTVLIKVKQIGDAACHMGYRSCFFRMLKEGKVIVDGDKIFDPSVVYKK